LNSGSRIESFCFLTGILGYRKYLTQPLLNYIAEKCRDNRIEVIKVNEFYTSKASCITENVCNVQTSKNTNALRSKRVARGLFKDTILNKVWNADLNGAVNHIN